MTTLLDDGLVDDALHQLEEWSGDAKRITRTVTLDDDKEVEQLLACVQEAADSLDHHPDVDRDGTSVRFELWTHSAGGVTELDITLASRISDLIVHVHPAADGGRTRMVAGMPADDAGQGRTEVAEPALPGEGSVPSRPEESATGDDDQVDATGLMHPPSTPRADTGPVVAPDTLPDSAEPMPRPDGPGMHEPEGTDQS
jgi:4a-hydroxytetrahydrobiopterin dehydratase